VEKDSLIGIKLGCRVREYRFGEKVLFSAREFNEIAFGCHLVGVDVAAKLPIPVQQAGSG
jgi:hypothetical protein